MAAYGATLLRLILGIVYIMHAYLAAVVFGPAGMIAYQTKNGVPFAEIGTWYLILAHGLGGSVSCWDCSRGGPPWPMCR